MCNLALNVTKHINEARTCWSNNMQKEYGELTFTQNLSYKWFFYQNLITPLLFSLLFENYLRPFFFFLSETNDILNMEKKDLRRMRNSPHNYKKTDQNIIELLHYTRKSIKNELDHIRICIDIVSPNLDLDPLFLFFLFFD